MPHDTQGKFITFSYIHSTCTLKRSYFIQWYIVFGVHVHSHLYMQLLEQLLYLQLSAHVHTYTHIHIHTHTRTQTHTNILSFTHMHMHSSSTVHDGSWHQRAPGHPHPTCTTADPDTWLPQYQCLSDCGSGGQSCVYCHPEGAG